MSKNYQGIFGFLNNQNIENTNIVVDDKYMRQLLIFKTNPSDLNQVVLFLYSEISKDEDILEKRAIPPEIEEKIQYNNVVRYKEIINSSYSENGFFLDSAYEALDFDVPGRKKKFLKYINILYLESLGEYIKNNPNNDRISVIRNNSDNIITMVINKLLLRLASNNTLIEHLSIESIEHSIIVIVTHAFVDCKVLENPNTI
ncbi:MAG: hypothetical protein WCF67_17960 [Chitinophagaceae bacterium]